MQPESIELYYSRDDRSGTAIVLENDAQKIVWRSINEDVAEVEAFNLTAERWSKDLVLSERAPHESLPSWGQVGQYGQHGCVLNAAREGWRGDRVVWVTLCPYDVSPPGLVAFLLELETGGYVHFRRSFLDASDCWSFAETFIFDPGEDVESLAARGDAIPSIGTIQDALTWGREHCRHLGIDDANQARPMTADNIRRFENAQVVEPPCYRCGGEGFDPYAENLCRICLGTGKLDFDTTPIDLSGYNLRCMDLSELDLTGGRLARAHLEFANLSRTELSGADLNGANLNDADLSAANLSAASLREATLVRTNLSQADLSDAVMAAVDLKDARLDEATLDRADLSGTHLAQAASLQGTRLLSVSGITDVELKGCAARGAITEDSSNDGADDH